MRTYNKMQTATRRGFLSFFGAAVAGATLDPERLLWKPRTKLISIPNAGRDPGLSIRVLHTYDWRTESVKLDVIYGFPAIPAYREYAAFLVNG